MKKALSLFLCLLLPVLMLAACGQPADDRTPEELFYALPVSSGITETLEDSALYDLFASGQPLRMNVDFSLDKFTIPMQADLSGTAFSFSMDCNSKADLRGNLTVDMPDEKVACDLLMTGENAYVFSDTLGEKWLPIPISSLFGQTGIDLGNELSASLNTQLLTRIEPVLTGCLDAMLNALRSYPLTTEQVSVVCGELEETGTAVTLELTAEQLITPLAGALTYLRDSSDAYSLITELSGEPMTEAEYREAIDDAIAELNESASELPDTSLKLTRTFKEGRQLSAAFTLTGDDSIEVAGELITLNPSSRKQAFSLDVRAAQQGAELLTLTADGSRNGGEKLLSASLKAEDADVTLRYTESSSGVDASLNIADAYGDGLTGSFTLKGEELNASLAPTEGGKQQPALLTLTGRVRQSDNAFDADLALSVGADGMRISIPLRMSMQQNKNGIEMRFSTSLEMSGTLDFAFSGSYSIVKIDDFTVEAPSNVCTPEEAEEILGSSLPVSGLPEFDF